MKEHIEQLAEEYVISLDYDEANTIGVKVDSIKEWAFVDFTAGINRVLQHPEEFGLQAKEYE